MSKRLEDFGLIGDCRTAALVGRDGSIDWLCWPRFDSAACFAAVLGTAENGRWLIAPTGATRRTSWRYREHTLVLETEHETDGGAVQVVDFMPIGASAPSIVRLVKGLRGRVSMRVELVLRFDYGRTVPWVRRAGDDGLRAISGPNLALLRSPIVMRGEDMKSIAEFEVGEGETIPFVLSYSPSHDPDPAPIDPAAALVATEAHWRLWSERCVDRFGAFSSAVRRSLITLKALTYEPTGGIVAAPTTSLPESLGGVRNWDYRYCWLRDATLTLLAFINAGYIDEARRWGDWLLRAAAGSPEQLQTLYGIAGERDLREWEVAWLPGYEGSKPVRVGNAAVEQLQIDVYGELLDALHMGRMAGLHTNHDAGRLFLALLGHLERIWREPDRGIWEIRGEPQQFTYSKIMSWVAFDRAIRAAGERKLDGAVDRWRAIRDEIHRDICEKAFDPDIGAFMQAYGSKRLDASVLKLPLVGFLPPDDARVVSTVAAIEKTLMRDGLVLRYEVDETLDGLQGEEGAFLACSFWLVDAYVMIGREDDARALFDRLLSLRNDLGLLAEEYDVGAKRLVGNFPQAFSHIALITSAANLASGEGPIQQRCGGDTS